jgi:hypothetical protein
LDRGPVLLAVALIAVYAFFTSKTLAQSTYRSILSLGFIIFTGGFITMVQYNDFNIDFFILLRQGLSVLLNRVIFDPSLMSLVFSFSEINGNLEPLMLKFSRISVLWGGSYVGTFDENSRFVAPVGIVGDIWRNFGHVGLLYISSIFSTFLMVVSGMQKKVNIYMKFPIFFLSVVLSFYLIVGSLFSVGPIVLIFIILIISSISNFEVNET